MKIGRTGMYGGKNYVFDHRDPKTGEVWSDDLPVYGGDNGKKIVGYGKWVDPKKIKWL